MQGLHQSTVLLACCASVHDSDLLYAKQGRADAQRAIWTGRYLVGVSVHGTDLGIGSLFHGLLLPVLRQLQRSLPVLQRLPH